MIQQAKRLKNRIAIRNVLRGGQGRVLGLWKRRSCRFGVWGFYNLDVRLTARMLAR